MSSRNGPRRRSFLLLSLLAGALAVVVGLALLAAVPIQDLGRFQCHLQRGTVVLAVLRLSLIAGWFLSWPALLRHGEHCGWMDASTRHRLHNARIRTLVWLLALEFLLGLDGINRLYAIARRILS